MTKRTRYFVLASLLVLGVGLSAGLVAYYTGFSISAFTALEPEELQLVPADASLVAYADVRGLMTSPLRQHLRDVLPMREGGQREFQAQTGINVETDIDHVVAFMTAPPTPDPSTPGSGMVLARGRFDAVKIEAVMLEHGATVEQYKGARIVTGPSPQSGQSVSLAFPESGLVAIGETSLLHAAIDRKSGGASVTSNDDIMRLIRDLDSESLWAVGRFDALASQAKFAAGVTQGLPSISWFSASARVDEGVHGVVRAEAIDEQAANGLRDMVRGLLAFGAMQASSQPAFRSVINSLQVGGTGKTVSVSFEAPAAVFDGLGGALNSVQPPLSGGR